MTRLNMAVLPFLPLVRPVVAAEDIIRVAMRRIEYIRRFLDRRIIVLNLRLGGSVVSDNAVTGAATTGSHD